MRISSDKGNSIRILFKGVIVLLLALFTTMAAWGFISGPDIIRECPKCKTSLVQHTMLSGNTNGAVFWTDGKVDALMFPYMPLLVKCPNCRLVFWIEDAQRLGEKPRGKSKEWSSVLEPGLPSEDDILRLLSKKSFERNKELYARRTAWWLVNDMFRENESTQINFSTEQIKNLRALADILDERVPEQRIMKSEIYRELGQFQDAIKMLQYEFKENDYSESARFIRKRALLQDSRVCEIKIHGKAEIIWISVPDNNCKQQLNKNSLTVH